MRSQVKYYVAIKESPANKGVCSSSIGDYVIDPFLLVKAIVAKDLVRINDYASDALPLRLASCTTIQKVL